MACKWGGGYFFVALLFRSRASRSLLLRILFLSFSKNETFFTAFIQSSSYIISTNFKEIGFYI
jgi:hypothetical protein